jgi:hypothetical protein
MTMSSQATNGGPRPTVSGGGAAAALLLTSGVLTFVVGVMALVAKALVVAGPGYEYTFQVTGWGWLNIVTGTVLAVTAGALFLHVKSARPVAIVVTCLAIVGAFLWMPYYPVWSAVLIALDVIVVWGIATWNTSRETP